MSWKAEPATLKQRSYLIILGIRPPNILTKGDASDLIDGAKKREKVDLRRRGLG